MVRRGGREDIVDYGGSNVCFLPFVVLHRRGRMD